VTAPGVQTVKKAAARIIASSVGISIQTKDRKIKKTALFFKKTVAEF
jgi:hypothetical protein